MGKIVSFSLPVDVGDSIVDVEKGKSSGPPLNRGKKRQLKANTGVAWGKLISQCPPVCLLFQLNLLSLILLRVKFSTRSENTTIGRILL